VNDIVPVTKLAHAAASAGAAVLPSPQPLTVGIVAPGDPQVAGPFAGAVLADIEGPVPGRIAVLVGKELVEALAGSPLGGLDLAAALQPTLDAVAESLHTRVGATRQVGLGLVARDVASPFTVAFLHAGSVAAAVLIPDAVLIGAQNSELSAAAPAAAPDAPVAEVEAPVLEEVGAVLSSVGGLENPRETQVHHHHGIELLHGVDMEVTVEIGRTRMTVRDLLELAPGAVLELDRAAGSPADLLVNGRLIARGEVVVIDEDFGLRITEIAVDAAVS
jgi:flagellar motor switch protein FliN/FliY